MRENQIAETPSEQAQEPRLLSEQIRNALTDAISTGELPPGSPLDEQQLADRFGVSRTPVREALRQLAASGLVEPLRRGMIVSRMTPHRIMELFETMAEFEAVSVRLATYRMTPLERSRLLRIYDEMDVAAGSGQVDAYDALNRDFHESLYKAAHNEVLADTVLSLRFRLNAFRRMQLRQDGRLLRSLDEHKAVMQAIAEGDGEAAAKLMRAHMLNAASALERFIESLHGVAG